MHALLERSSPVTGQLTWSGTVASQAEVAHAMDQAHRAAPEWHRTDALDRIDCLRRYATYLAGHREAIAHTISLESGKPLWESELEVASSIAKVDLAIEAFRRRRDTIVSSGPTSSGPTSSGPISMSEIVFRPIGPMLVLGPFNLPLHLPGAHLVPALLAGNTIVFKPSEKTPAVGDWIAQGWQAAGLPTGVFTMLQGGPEVAMAALDSPHIGGVLFTGSLHAGLAIHRRFAGRPEILLALEMGGNNPLVIDRVADVRGAVETIIQSAFLTSGQRCTCARRLVLVDTDANRQLLDELGRTIPRIRVGDPFGNPAPYLGTLIDAAATQRVLHKQQTYIDGGMHARCRAEGIGSLGTQLTPGLLEDPKATADDEEVFGPLLVARWVPDLDAAIAMANATRFGLSASLLSDDEGAFRTFQREVRAGIVNWNHPTTGATGTLPFGGLGLSGNHRSSGYFAADYCSDPVASLRRPRVAQAELGPTGLEGLWTS